MQEEEEQQAQQDQVEGSGKEEVEEAETRPGKFSQQHHGRLTPPARSRNITYKSTFPIMPYGGGLAAAVSAASAGGGSGGGEETREGLGATTMCLEAC